MAKRRHAARPAPAPVVRARPRTRDRAEPARRSLPSGRVLLGGLLVLGVVLLLGFSFLSSATARDYACSELLTARPDVSASDGFTTPFLGQDHVARGTRIRYGFCPPTSGSHYNERGVAPLRPGFYGPDADAGPGGWVHNFEHGYVVALYRCADGTCPSDTDLAALRRFAENGPSTQSAAACGYRSKVLVARFDDMSTPFALLAWNRASLLDTFDPVAAQAFAGRWIDRTAPEPNAC